MNTLLIAVFMVTIANRLVEGLIKPLFEKYELDKFWLMYVAWIIGGLLTFATGVNLLEKELTSPLLGQIMTALIAGGGANLLNDLFAKRSVSAKYDQG